MEVFAEYLTRIDHPEHRARMEEVLNWVKESYPVLSPKIAWNQPMFTDHDTFIVGFSVSKQHIAVAPEKVVIQRFADDITQAGYTHTKELIRMPWKNEVDFALLAKLIEFNISDKADCTTFWRK